METVGKFVEPLLRELSLLVDWALQHWLMTALLLILLIYWTGRYGSNDRRGL